MESVSTSIARLSVRSAMVTGLERNGHHLHHIVMNDWESRMVTTLPNGRQGLVENKKWLPECGLVR
jgi:hypothetical protein